MLQSDFRSLRVRAFDPQSNFTSTLMFENNFNFFWKYFSVDPKMGTWFFRRNLKSQACCYTMETLKKFLKDLGFRRKNKVPIFGSTEKIFFGKVGKIMDIKIESKFDCGSNESTLSTRGNLWKWVSDLGTFFPLNVWNPSYTDPGSDILCTLQPFASAQLLQSQWCVDL